MPPKKIILENTVCSNTGDGAIMLAAVKILKAAFGEDVQVQVFDSDAKTSKKLYPDFEFYDLLSPRLFKTRLGASFLARQISRLKNMKSWTAAWAVKSNLDFLAQILVGSKNAEALRIYREADMVMSTGGTYLVEHYDLKIRMTQFRLDQYLGKPLIFFTQSLGPYQQQSNIETLRDVMEESPLILLRDEKSYTHLDPVLKDKRQCHVVADSVFALAEVDKIEKIINGETKIDPQVKKVAVSVREWPHFTSCTPEEGMAKYKASVVALVEKLVSERNIEVTFISTCQGLPDYRYDDSKIAQEIFESLLPAIQKNVSVNSDYHDPVQVMDILSDMDMVVATRMHMMILALCAGKPVLPISYEFKTTELSQDMRLSKILSDIETVTPEDIEEKADLLLNNFEEMSVLTMQGVLEQYNSAMQAVPLIQKALNLPPETMKSAGSSSTAPDSNSPASASKTVSSLAA